MNQTSSDNAASSGYRPCVGVMLINRDGLVWVGQRADMPSAPEGGGTWWQMPQGGIDTGEDPRAAAHRELYEETRVRSAQIIGETREWLTYDLPPELIGKVWGGRWHGQRQKWFAARFLGDDTEIDISALPGHDAEFLTWQWVPAGALTGLIVPFKRHVYEQLVGELGPLAQPMRSSAP